MMKIRIAAAVALLALPVAPAFAQSGVRQACRDDVKQLCAGVQPGGGRIKQCLKDNAAKVSDGCKQAIQAARASKPGG
jgi:hypothetical protein